MSFTIYVSKTQEECAEDFFQAACEWAAAGGGFKGYNWTYGFNSKGELAQHSSGISVLFDEISNTVTDAPDVVRIGEYTFNKEFNIPMMRNLSWHKDWVTSNRAVVVKYFNRKIQEYIQSNEYQYVLEFGVAGKQRENSLITKFAWADFKLKEKINEENIKISRGEKGRNTAETWTYFEFVDFRDEMLAELKKLKIAGFENFKLIGASSAWEKNPTDTYDECGDRNDGSEFEFDSL